MSDYQVLSIHQADRLTELLTLLAALHSLMLPGKDLSQVNRDNLACLLDYFARRLNNAADQEQKAFYHRCLFVVIDLIAPESDLSGVNREGLSTIFGYLHAGLDQALQGELV